LADQDPRTALDALDGEPADTPGSELQGLLSSVTSPFLAQNSRFLPPEDRWQGRTGNAHDANGHWEAAAAQAKVPQSGPADSGNAAPQGGQAAARSVQQQEALDIAALDRARDERLD
jgi:hypothetical protein